MTLHKGSRFGKDHAENIHEICVAHRLNPGTGEGQKALFVRNSMPHGLSVLKITMSKTPECKENPLAKVLQLKCLRLKPSHDLESRSIKSKSQIVGCIPPIQIQAQELASVPCPCPCFSEDSLAHRQVAGKPLTTDSGTKS